MAKLATYMDSSERTVQRTLASLEKKGVITRHKNMGGKGYLPGNRRPNLYTINLHISQPEVSPANHEVTSAGVTEATGVTDTALWGDTQGPDSNTWGDSSCHPNHPTKPPKNHPGGGEAEEGLTKVNIVLGKDEEDTPSRVMSKKPAAKRPDRPAEPEMNKWDTLCNRCGKSLTPGQGVPNGHTADKKRAYRCATKCEDTLGKKAELEQFFNLVEDKVAEAALPYQEVDKQNPYSTFVCIMELKNTALIGAVQGKKPNEAVEEVREPFISRYGEENFNLAYNVLKTAWKASQ